MKAIVVGFTLTFATLVIVSAVCIDLFGQRIVDRFPVVDGLAVSRAEQTPEGMVGFYLTSHKVREGTPRYVAFYVVGPLREGAPVIAFKGDATCAKEKDDELVAHPVGRSWTTHFCFRIQNFDPTVSYSVVGEEAHAAWPFAGSAFEILVHESLPSFVPRKVEVMGAPS